MPAPTVAFPTRTIGTRRRVSAGVSIRRTTTIRTQKRITPATSENAASTWSASIQSSKLTPESYGLVADRRVDLSENGERQEMSLRIAGVTTESEPLQRR